jgi:prepilin-type N-terminal cleavage/methylation domain-containing protein
MKKTKRNSGFTLFELLVSISIIAILTAVAVVSFGGLNKKTRDARRTSDLEKVRLTLEAARQIGNTYPSSLTSLVGLSLLEKVPTDPKGVGYTYAYSVGTSNYSYVMCAYMEDVGSTNITSSTGCASCGLNSCNYKVVNP